MNNISPTHHSGSSQGLIRSAVILVYMVFGALLNSVGSINLLAVQSMGVTRADTAVLDAYKDLPIAIVSFLVASLLPRLGLRRAMLIGLAAVGVGCALMPVLASFWAIKLLFVTIGTAFALVKVSAYSMIGLLTRDERSHASFTNLLEGMFMVGVLGGYWLFSAAVDNSHPESTAWLGVYWVLTAIIAVSFCLLAVSRVDETEARASGTGAARNGSLAGDINAMLRLMLSGLVMVFVLSAFLYVLIEQGVATWLPSFNNEVLHMPAAMSVGLAVIMPASTAIGRLASAVVIARVGWYSVVNLCVVAIAALIVLTLPLSAGLQPNPAMGWASAPLVAYMFPLIGLFLAPIYPAINSAMLSVLPKSRHAAMTGLIVIFSALGGSFGSFVTGRLFMAFDGRTAFALLLVPIAVLALFLWLFHRALRRQAHDTTSHHSTLDPRTAAGLTR
jgi:FHS family glucose/mannose:H+ symporter-like MFS transporter